MSERDDRLKKILASLNDRQKEAVTDSSLQKLVVAGPGAGKTLSLVMAIAYAVASGKAYAENVCAITFTNKAASEMKTRLANILTEEELGKMQISTFHSLGVLILRSNTKKAGLKSGFTIYDEDDRYRLVKQVIKENPNSRVSAYKLSEYISEKKNGTVVGDYWSSELQRMYKEYEDKLITANAVDFDDLIKKPLELFQKNPDILEHYQDKYQHLFLDEFQDTNGVQNALALLLAKKYGNIFVIGDSDQCLAKGTLVTMANGEKRAIETIQVRDKVLTGVGEGRFRPAFVTRIHKQQAKELVRITTNNNKVLSSTANHTHFASYASDLELETASSHKRMILITLMAQDDGSKVLHELAVFGDNEEEHSELAKLDLPIYSSSSVVTDWWQLRILREDVDELLELAKSIAKIFPAQVVMKARLGTKLSSALLEKDAALQLRPAALVRRGMLIFTENGEFDVVEKVETITDVAQVYDIDVENTHNFIANGIVTHNSIYGWRGADFHNLLDFESNFPQAKSIVLNQNYRSSQGLVDIAQAVIRNNILRKEKHLWSSNKTSIPARFIVGNSDIDEAAQIVEEIKRLRAKEGHAYKDCAVLYRTNSQSRAFEAQLNKQKIPYMLIGGTAFYQRKEVKDIMAYLRVINNEDDVVAWQRIINVPPRGIGDKTINSLMELSISRGLSLVEAMRQVDENFVVLDKGRAGIAELVNLIDEVKKNWSSLTLADVVDKIITDSNYHLLLSGLRPEEMEMRRDNIYELQGYAANYKNSARADIEEFLADAALMTDLDKTQDSKDRVTLITMHKSKGLEYPVVFCSGVEDKILPHARSTGDDELEEERRLFYVALTRAKERVYISRAKRRQIRGQIMPSFKSPFWGELPLDKFEVSDRDLSV